MKLPLELYEKDNNNLYDNDGDLMAVVFSKNNVSPVMKACNNHDKLLEALKGLMSNIGGGKKHCGHDFTCSCAWDKAEKAIKEAE